MSTIFIAGLGIINMLGIFLAYKCGVLVERIRWNELIEEDYIQVPKELKK